MSKPRGWFRQEATRQLGVGIYVGVRRKITTLNSHDFPNPDGKAIPYGIYDLGRNRGVSVGIDDDTATFAVVRRETGGPLRAATPAKAGDDGDTDPVAAMTPIRARAQRPETPRRWSTPR